MAKCYHCGKRFRGLECYNCGKEPRYWCWKCKKEIPLDIACECTCGWYVCPYCESCGCNNERPLSLQEKEDRHE